MSLLFLCQQALAKQWSSAAVRAARHNGAFRWRARQHIHWLIFSIVAAAHKTQVLHKTSGQTEPRSGKQKGGRSVIIKKKTTVDAAMKKTQCQTDSWEMQVTRDFVPATEFPVSRSVCKDINLFFQTIHLPLKYSSSCWIFHGVCVLECQRACGLSVFIGQEKVKEVPLYNTCTLRPLPATLRWL